VWRRYAEEWLLVSVSVSVLLRSDITRDTADTILIRLATENRAKKYLAAAFLFGALPGTISVLVGRFAGRIAAIC